MERVTDKKLIDFLIVARPNLLDFTEEEIIAIGKNAKLMSALKEIANDYQEDWNATVGASTSLAPYQSMGWYLAIALRKEVKAFAVNENMTISEFLKSNNEVENDA